MAVEHIQSEEIDLKSYATELTSIKEQKSDQSNESRRKKCLLFNWNICEILQAIKISYNW